MVAVTYGGARVAGASAAKRTQGAAQSKTAFGRFVDALMESRLRQAEREIRRHAHLLPRLRDDNGNPLD
jgi:hypothetical protein